MDWSTVKICGYPVVVKDMPEAPRDLILLGSPPTMEARIWPEPVGEDWGGSPKPVNEIAYGPSPLVSVYRCLATLEAIDKSRLLDSLTLSDKVSADEPIYRPRSDQ